MKYFFVDTNLFLQCRDVSDLPWNQISSVQHLQLIIPRAVQSEIDRLKGDGNNRRAKRARTTTAYFRKILFSEGEQLLVSNRSQMEVSITLSPISPAHPTDEQKNFLDSARADDSILLEIIAYRSLYPDSDVALLTHDTNPMVTAKKLGIPFQAIPDDWLLTPEPDERDRELRILKSRVDELEKHAPKIEISILEVEGPQPKKLCALMEHYHPLSSSEIQILIEEITRRYPMVQSFESIERPVSKLNKEFEAKLLGMSYKYIPPSAQEIESYKNVAYPNWLKSVKEELIEIPGYLANLRNTFKATLAIANNGNVPAEHTIIRIEVSDGFVILPPPNKGDKNSVDGWKLPPPPVAPTGRYEESSPLFALSRALKTNALPRFTEDFIRPNRMPQPRDRNGFYHKPHRPSEPKKSWEFECDEFRHQDEPEEFYLELSVVADNKNINGQLKCSVMATNLPTPAVMEIPLIVSCSDGDVMKEVRILCGLPLL